MAATYLATPVLPNIGTLWLTLAMAAVIGLIATRAASWMVAPYADSPCRRLLWGLAAAALLPVVLVLATMIFLGREGAYFDGLKR